MPAPLPFLVAPKAATRIVSAEVNGETCSLEFPVFGAITSGESIDIAEHEYQSAVYAQSSRLADALVVDGSAALNLPADASAEQIETEASRLAIRIVSTRMGLPLPLTGAEQRVMTRQAELIAEVTNHLNTAFKALTVRKATAAIVHRLPGCEGWSDADVRRLPQPLQEAIAAFIDSEKAGPVPDRSPEEMVEEMVETLGKLDPPASADTPATTPDSSSQLPPTGEPPTGDAASSGQLLLSSAPSDSDSSPPPTSPRRSRRANAG